MLDNSQERIVFNIAQGEGWFLTGSRRNAITAMFFDWSDLKRENSAHRKQIADLQERLKNVPNQNNVSVLVEQLNATVDELQTKNEVLNKKLAMLKQERDEEYTAHSDLLAALDEKEILIRSQEDALNSLKKNMDEAKEDIAKESQKASRMKEEVKREREERENLSAAFLETQKRVEELEYELTETAVRAVAAEGKNNELQIETQDLAARAVEAEGKYSDLKNDTKKVAELLQQVLDK